jgi:CheY-like chemotaxis protein
VQRLVDLHGGTVTAHSAGTGSGSEFVVRLPRQLEPAEVKSGASTPVQFDRGAVRILVVDDNADSCATLATFLRLQGYGVQTVHSGSLALQMARSTRPNVVLLDIGLPGLSGYDVARVLRQEFADDVMQLVAITGYGRDEDVRQAQEAGFDMHFLKPVDPVELDRFIASGKRPTPAA